MIQMLDTFQTHIRQHILYLDMHLTEINETLSYPRTYTKV